SLAIPTYTGDVVLWDIKTGQTKTLSTGTPDELRRVAFSPDGTLLAAASYRTTAWLWDVKTGKLRATMSDADAEHVYQITDIAFSPDSKLLAVAHAGGIVRLWDTRTATIQNNVPAKDFIFHIAFSPDGSLLAVGARGDLVIWDMKKKQIRATLGTLVDRINT